jgi:DNA-binding GntR family transcriptional regulator
VERIPKKGIRIRNFTLDDLDQLYQLREILETGAVRIIAKDINEKQLKDMKCLVNLLESACANKNVEAYQAADLEFHRLLIQFTGNQRMEEVFESIILQSRLFMSIGAYKTAFPWAYSTETLEAVSHKHIYETLAKHDVKNTELLVSKHIEMGHNLSKIIMTSMELRNSIQSQEEKT